MKLRTLASLGCLLPLAAFGCSGDDESPGPGAADGGGDVSVINPQNDAASTPDVKTSDQAAPNADAKSDVVADVTTVDATDAQIDGASPDADAQAEAEPPESAVIDPDRLREAAVQLDAKAVSVLPSLKGLINLFIEDDPNLQPDGGTAANAISMYARLRSLTDSPCGSNAAATQGDEVSITFPGCTVNNLDLQGRVVATVSRVSNVLTVTFKLTDLRINSYTATGTLTVQVPDLITYPTDMDLTVTDLGGLTFAGTGSLSVLDGGTLSGKVSGTGAFLPAGSDAGTGTVPAGRAIVTNGWDCRQQGPTAYEAKSLTRALNSCYASSGQLIVQRTFRCEKPAVVRNPIQNVTSYATIEWLPTTPTDHVVNVTLSSTVADASVAGATYPVTIPWTCAYPTRTDGGLEAGHEASTEAGGGGADAAAD